MKKKTKAFISIASVAAAAAGTLAYVGNYFYNYAINSKISRNSISNAANGVEDSENKKNLVRGDLDWFNKESNYENISITSFDNLKLSGYKILNTELSNKWAITVHGYNSEGNEMTGYAKEFYDRGYNCIIPNLRSHGNSEGNYIGMGWHDRLDILKWIDLILKEDKYAQIVLHGLSMGAATVTMTSGEDLPGNVKAIIADCGYTSVWDQFSHQLKLLFKLPRFPVLNAASIVTKHKAGFSLRSASALKQVIKSKTPILFIHGDKDDYVPYEMMKKLYDAAKCDKEMITIEGAKHAKAVEVNPQLYWSSIDNFIEKYVI